MSTTPTAAELSDLSLCVQKLWDIDDNKLEPEVDYGIDVQEGKRTHWEGDYAEGRLFRGVSKSVWQRPSYRVFYSLLDNYEKETGRTETVTSQERAEMDAFIDAVYDSKPVRYVQNYLAAKNLASADALDFKRILYDLWFGFYRVDARNDSSGFEHVFVGESDGDEMKGFHNWIQFFVEEARGRADYRGYIHGRRGAPEPDVYERVMQMQLAWDGEVKAISTFFIGSSPEFEIATYTLYFLAGDEVNYANFLNYRISIRCYRRGRHRIGTTYVSIENEQ